MVRYCPEILPGWPGSSARLVALLLRLHCCGTQGCSSLLQRVGSGWAPELGSHPRLTLQTSGAVSLPQGPLRCNPMQTGKMSGDPCDSDLALNFPGLGDGRQVTRRHHHGPVGRWSSRYAQPGLPPCPPSLQGLVSLGAQIQAPVSLQWWMSYPAHHSSPPLSPQATRDESQQVFLGGQ